MLRIYLVRLNLDFVIRNVRLYPDNMKHNEGVTVQLLKHESHNIKYLRTEMAEYPTKIYCSKCKKETPHREKLGAVLNGCLVCNICNKMNKTKPSNQ